MIGNIISKLRIFPYFEYSKTCFYNQQKWSGIIVGYNTAVVKVLSNLQNWLVAHTPHFKHDLVQYLKYKHSVFFYKYASYP